MTSGCTYRATERGIERETTFVEPRKCKTISKQFIIVVPLFKHLCSTRFAFNCVWNACGHKTIFDAIKERRHTIKAAAPHTFTYTLLHSMQWEKRTPEEIWSEREQKTHADCTSFFCACMFLIVISNGAFFTPATSRSLRVYVPVFRNKTTKYVNILTRACNQDTSASYCAQPTNTHWVEKKTVDYSKLSKNKRLYICLNAVLGVYATKVKRSSQCHSHLHKNTICCATAANSCIDFTHTAIW